MGNPLAFYHGGAGFSMYRQDRYKFALKPPGFFITGKILLDNTWPEMV